jgi:hypothetical protein
MWKDATLGVAVNMRNQRREGGQSSGAECSASRASLDGFPFRQFGCKAKSGNERNGLCSRAEAALLSSSQHERLEWRSPGAAPTPDECSHALWAKNFVATQAN